MRDLLKKDSVLEDNYVEEEIAVNVRYLTNYEGLKMIVYSDA